MTIQPQTSPLVPKARAAGGDFIAGARFLTRGFGIYLRDRRLLALGSVPALIAVLLVGSALAAVLYFIGDLSAAVTWFADDWSDAVRTATRIAAGIAIVALALVMAALTYTALTLIIGDPFYEVISERVERASGQMPPEIDLPWHTTFLRNLVDSVRLLMLSVAISVPLFVAGLLPAIGQTVVPVIDVVLGGWLLAVELTGVPFNRRGLRLADRRRMLAANRARALGFGVPAFLLLMIPLAALIVVPAAVCGATLLTRAVLDEQSFDGQTARR